MNISAASILNISTPKYGELQKMLLETLALLKVVRVDY